MKRFKNRSLVQRELLHAVVNKVLTSLLMDQQRILAGLEMPTFKQDVIQKLENAVTNSKSMNHHANVNPFEVDPQLQNALQRQQALVSTLLSSRMSYLRHPELRHKSEVYLHTSSIVSDVSSDWGGRQQQLLKRPRTAGLSTPAVAAAAQIAPTLSVPILPALSALPSLPSVPVAVTTSGSVRPGLSNPNPLFYNPPRQQQSANVRRR